MSQSLDKVPAVSCFSSRRLKTGKWISFTYGLSTFQIGAFVLVTRLCQSTHEPFQSGFPVPYRFIVFLNIMPIDFQSQVFWELISPVKGLKVGVFNVELQSLAPQEKVLYIHYPSQL